jgi:hypothetical protein
MSTPEQPSDTTETTPSSSGTTGGYSFTPVAGARMPIPGNAEFALWLAVEIIVAIIWAASDFVNAQDFVTATTFLTVGYILSRGIAKASRVLEQ